MADKILHDLSLTATPLTMHTVRITWKDIPTAYLTHAITLERAEINPINWVTVATLSPDMYPYYDDADADRTFYMIRSDWYRLRIADIGVSEPKTVGSHINFYAAEMIRRHSIRLREGHEGSLFYLFSKRTTSERCPDCWDAIRQQRSTYDCPTCYGTGFVHGYYDALPIYISISPEQIAPDVPLTGITVQGQMSGWTSGFPLLNPGDIVIDPTTSYLWEVKTIGVNTHKRIITKQDVLLVRVDDDNYNQGLLKQVPEKPDIKVDRHGKIIF